MDAIMEKIAIAQNVLIANVALMFVRSWLEFSFVYKSQVNILAGPKIDVTGG